MMKTVAIVLGLLAVVSTGEWSSMLWRDEGG